MENSWRISCMFTKAIQRNWPTRKQWDKTTTQFSRRKWRYKVEAILSHCLHKNCETTYLIKWKGYNSSENSWEPKSNLTNAEEELDNYKRHRNIQWRQQPGHIHTTPCSRIRTNLHHSTCYYTPLLTHHQPTSCQKITMNSQNANIRRDDFTFTLVEQHSSSDK